MTKEKLTLLERIVNVSPFKEHEAEMLWLELLESFNSNASSLLDQKILREFFAGNSQFADCTAITK